MDTRANWTQYVVKMRWLMLLAIALWAAMAPRLGVEPRSGAVGLLLLAGLLFNALLFIQLSAARPPAYALPTLLADVLLVALAVRFTGGAHSPLYFLYLQPLIFSAALFRLTAFACSTALILLLHLLLAEPGLTLQSGQEGLLLQALFLAFAAMLLLRVAGDRSEHEQSAGSLTPCEQPFDALLAHLDLAVLVTDPEGVVRIANPAAARLLHTSSQALEGQPLAQAVGSAEVTRIVDRALSHQRLNSGEAVFENATDKSLRVTAAPVTGGDGKALGYVVALNDITEARRLEALKSQFVSALSHELRTPLTSIKAYAATLLRQPEVDVPTQTEFLGIINSQCDRLTELINDLLDVSNLDAGKKLSLNLEPLEVKAAADRVFQAHRALTDRHTFDCTLEPGAETVTADAQRLHQMLNNLVSNALKYSPDGGEIRIHSRVDGDESVLEVSDQGMGLAPEHQAAIFDKFYQVDGGTTRRVGGSGTGLYLVKHLVEAHGGTVGVRSTLGKGSTFILRLPRTPSDPH